MKATASNDVEMLSKVAETRLFEQTTKALQDHTAEINSPRIVTCQVKELLKAEIYTIPKSLQIRSKPTKIFRLPLST